jgi:signal transduction histidine kinase
VKRLARLEEPLRRGDGDAARRLGRAIARLRALDGELRALAASLVRTAVDDQLLFEVVRAVQAEPAAGGVALDELTIASVPAGVFVEAYRVDLLLVLKNLVRNAVLAAGRGEAPRRVALDVTVELEATGEELVRLRVRDTNREPLSTDALYDRRPGPLRGLAIVTTALSRLDGVLEVGPGGDGFAKAVTVRLFRALDLEAERLAS